MVDFTSIAVITLIVISVLMCLRIVLNGYIRSRPNEGDFGSLTLSQENMKTTTACMVRQCSKCPGNTEYVCLSCQCDMCRQCTENHLNDFTAQDHDVVVYRQKFNYIPYQNKCERHLNSGYKMYCKNCILSACSIWLKLTGNKFFGVRTQYEPKRQRYKKNIHKIKSSTLYRRSVKLTKIKSDIQMYRTEFHVYQSEIIKQGQKLKDRIDDEVNNLMNSVSCNCNIKHSCLKQKILLKSNIAKLQRYEDEDRQSAMEPVKFLLNRKKTHRTLLIKNHTRQFFATQTNNKEMVTKLLIQIEPRQRKKRHIENENYLKLMPGPELHQSLTVTAVDCCNHISRVTSNRFWVSYNSKLVLTDMIGGDTLHYCRKDLFKNLFVYGKHTINKDGELFFIDIEFEIIKISKDMKSTEIFLKRPYSNWNWRPHCVYLSASTSDLLVGMYDEKFHTGKVSRYNMDRQQTQTIEGDKAGHNLYKDPRYITENNNGDVIVSDNDMIVVTDCQGKHRFSYTGHTAGSELKPLGISTDALSHILVCDCKTNTVQMIDKDGQFLSHLLVRPFGIFKPCSLTYDASTHCLWVGSSINNKVCVYKYITRNDDLIDINFLYVSSPNKKNARDTETIQEGNLYIYNSDVMESSKTNLIIDKETLQEPNPDFLKISTLWLFHSISVTGIHCCYHISFVKPNMMWVSDTNNLILTNNTGEIEHHLTDLSSNYNGLHTVNSESELIYISGDGNIKKLSKDMKTTTTFIEQSEPKKSTPQCVYWSSSTNDLLIGMRSKVSRYNLNGQLTQTVQYDKTGKLEIYCDPNYITENNNGDIVVSDFGAVVVTERSGRYRFSYTGHPLGSGLDPRGICTDALSHILVCDATTKTVHMLNKDGEFLSHLLALREQMDSPYSLSYDVNTNHLYVGSDSHNNNTVHVYKYITEQDEEYEFDVMFGSTPEVLTKTIL